jgi:subtilisin family serine protease
MRHNLLFFLTCLLSALAAEAQAVPGRYIVEFDSEPAVASAASAGGRLAEAAPLMAARRAQIQAEHAVHEAAIRGIGGIVIRRYDTILNAVAVQVPGQSADQAMVSLRALPGVRAVYPDKRWHTVLDQAVIAHHITDTWATLPGGASSAGAGTMVAVLDTGIDSSHPGFHGFNTPVPSGFPLVTNPSDTAYTNNKVIVVRDYTSTEGMDMVGHGTGVAMIAAGLTNTPVLDCVDVAGCSTSFTFPENQITGVASGAWLGNYKVCDDTGGCYTSDFLAALGDVLNDAAALQKATGTPDLRVVVNYSAGGPSLSASDESGAEARAIQNAVTAGIPVVVAAGNDGFNINGGQSPSTIGDPGVTPDAITVGAVVNQRIFDYSVTAAGATPFGAAIPDTSNDSNSPDLVDPIKAPIVDVSTIDGSGLGCSTLTAGSLSGKIALIQRGTCTFNAKLDNAAVAGAVAAVVYNNAAGGLVNMQLSDASLPALFVAQADGQNLKSMIGSKAGIAVTMDFAGLTPFPFVLTAGGSAISDVVTTYSAAGPTASGSIKPDMLAVGGDFLPLDCSGLNNANAQVLTADTTANDSVHPYTIESGTSFSSPFVSGSIAVLKAAHPGLTATQYRSLVINSAPQFISAGDGSQGTPTVVGSGKLNLLSASQNNLTAVPSSINFKSAAGQVNSTIPVVLTNVGGSSDTFTVTVNSIDGSIHPSVDKSMISLSPGASQTINVTLNGSGLAAGPYDGYLAITGTQTSVTTRIGYWFGAPGSTVQNISVLNQNQLDGGGSPGESDLSILIRYTDVAGLPIAAAAPTVTAQAARSKVLRILPAGDIPGTYEIDIQLGRVSGTYDEFDVTIGSLTLPVYVPVY